jgi:hypothetical protein
MSHSTASASGTPIARPSATLFPRSATNRAGVMRLKPNRASITKVRYAASGRSIAPAIAATLRINAMPWA